MEEFFIRHANGMTVVEDAINCLWAHNKIAIHFEDRETLDVEDKDFVSGEKKAVNTLKKLKESGGYIWAEYRNKDSLKVGKILPLTRLDICKTKYDFNLYAKRFGKVAARQKTLEKAPDYTAKLRTLQIDEKTVKTVPLARAKTMELYDIRPPRVALCQWPASKGRLRRLVDLDP